MTDKDLDYGLATTATGSRIHCVEFNSESIFAKVHGIDSLSLCLLYEDFEEISYKELDNYQFCKTCRAKIDKGEFDGPLVLWQKVIEYNDENYEPPEDEADETRKGTAA